MTQGGADARRIRIRLSGDQPQDLRALQRWLGLEEWFTEAQTRYGLTVVYRERDGTEQPAGQDGPAMGGVVSEIVLMLAGGVLTPVFDDLYQHAKTSVRAFADNLSSSRRSVEPEVTAEDASGPQDSGTGPGEGAGPPAPRPSVPREGSRPPADDGEAEGIG